MEELLSAEKSYAIRGAIFDVYREMGSGFLEPVNATGMKLGLLANFGSYSNAEVERRIL